MTHPLRLVVAFFLGIAAFSAFVSAAKAAPALRPAVTISREIVLLGDLVSDAGALSEKPIFRAPEHGLTGTLSAETVINAAMQAGLAHVVSGGVTEVSVTRNGRAAGKSEIESALRLALAEHSRSPAPENIDISFNGTPLITGAASDTDLSVRVVDWSEKNGRFEAEITLGDPSRPVARQTITGNALDGVEVVVPTRSIARSKVLSPEDLTLVRLPRRNVSGEMVTSIAYAVGMAAGRALRADEPVKSGDLDKPVLVERSSVVTIVHAVPGMTLTVRGQALASGARGATISVINSQSKRVIEGVVSGPGQVTVASGHAVVLSAR
jgi:flagella basal body P-ring formation protein FlgA